MITAVLAFLADALIGDPRSRLHPVVMIGSLIAALERSLYHEGDTDRRKLWAGGLLAVTVLLVVYNLAACLLQLIGLCGNHYFTLLAEAFLLSFTISPRSLAAVGREIYDYLLREIWKMPAIRWAGLWAVIQTGCPVERLSGPRWKRWRKIR